MQVGILSLILGIVLFPVAGYFMHEAKRLNSEKDQYFTTQDSSIKAWLDWYLLAECIDCRMHQGKLSNRAIDNMLALIDSDKSRQVKVLIDKEEYEQARLIAEEEEASFDLPEGVKEMILDREVNIVDSVQAFKIVGLCSIISLVLGIVILLN